MYEHISLINSTAQKHAEKVSQPLELLFTVSHHTRTSRNPHKLPEGRFRSSRKKEVALFHRAHNQLQNSLLPSNTEVKIPSGEYHHVPPYTEAFYAVLTGTS
uniref:Uncharacterized protein n=1 Tax=Calidris pygmaea TaxID=425635 RepID=A0A8C3KQ96_9CHAR